MVRMASMSPYGGAEGSDGEVAVRQGGQKLLLARGQAGGNRQPGGIP